MRKKTIFIIEASSYQIDYSKIFKTKYAVILNLSPDHLERHGTLNKYVNAKFKLIKNQNIGNLAFVKENDNLIKKYIKRKKFKSKIVRVNSKKVDHFLKKN